MIGTRMRPTDNHTSLDSESFDPHVTLNNGVRMPVLGIGLYQVPPGSATESAVGHALEAGYRLIDTAKYYGNESDVGKVVRRSGVSRREIFVTTKLWNEDHGYDRTRRAFDRSMTELGLEYVDLYLIHWPAKDSVPPRWQPVVEGLRRIGIKTERTRRETWKAMEELLRGGRCRTIGVSNYTVRHLKELLAVCGVVPAVNQVEFTPFCFQRDLLEFCIQHGIQLQAYSPLVRGERLNHPALLAVAARNKRTVPQILLRWALQHRVAVIPKASQRAHILENAAIFDFVLSAEDMRQLDSLNENLHLCWDPTDVP
jgi:diketogulonate reductase-like aldo/keto reductase